MLPTTNWHLPATEQQQKVRVNPVLFHLQHALRGIQGRGGRGIQGRGLQGNWWNRSLDRYFQELSSRTQPLHFLQSRKAVNPFMVTLAPCDRRKMFCKISAWLHWTPPSTKSHINMLTFPHDFLEQSLRAIWGAVSWASVLILPQIKLNSQLLDCASFLVNDANPCFSCFNYFNQTLLFYFCILTALSHQSHSFVTMNVLKHIEQFFFPE